MPGYTRERMLRELELAERALDGAIARLQSQRQAFDSSDIKANLLALFEPEGFDVPTILDSKVLISALEQRKQSLLERYERLETIRQRIQDFHDHSVAIVLDLTSDDGDLASVFDTDSYQDDQELFEEAERISLRYRIELEKTWYQGLLRTLDEAIDAVMEEKREALDQIDQLDTQMEELEVGYEQ